MIELKDLSQKNQKNQKSKEGDSMNRVSNIYIYISEKGGKALVPFSLSQRLSKGGLRWNNISDKGGVVNG